MRIRLYHRSLLLFRFALIAAIVAVISTVIEVLYVRTALAREAAREPPSLRSEKIFISSIHWTSQAVLEEHWISAVVNLAKEIGRDNVFVSIQESGSLDDTKGALRLLDSQLAEAGIQRKIVLNENTHLDAVSDTPTNEGWIKAPHGEWELRRIPYLAAQRNLALKPLYELQQSGVWFDKILFLNDVVFSSRDIRTLLNTKDGEYAAACSLDFKKPPKYYDTFVLRDSKGQQTITPYWPYFVGRASRQALKASVAVPVASCWNGIVAMDAAPFYNKERILSFRGIPDDLAKNHLEGSECCLIHADNALSQSKGVWLNPNVRVGYDGRAYQAVSGHSWLSTSQIVHGIWSNRIYRVALSIMASRAGKVQKRLTEWQRQAPQNIEPGHYCLIDEMQILTWHGWAHVGAHNQPIF